MLDMNTGLHKEGVDSAGADIEILLSASAKPGRWSMGGFAWSYEPEMDTSVSAGIDIYATLTDTATLSDTATVGSTKVFSVDVNDDGAGFIIPAEPFKFPPARAVRIVMRGAGDDVVRKLSILGAKLV